jgi:hypothetical protein
MNPLVCDHSIAASDVLKVKIEHWMDMMLIAGEQITRSQIVSAQCVFC